MIERRLGAREGPHLHRLEIVLATDVIRPDAAAARRLGLRGNLLPGRATVDAVQIFGGYGFVNDYPVEKLMRDARAFEALLGDERLGRVLAHKAVQ